MKRAILVATALAALTLPTHSDDRFPWLEGKQYVQQNWFHQSLATYRRHVAFEGKRARDCLPRVVNRQLDAVNARWPIDVFSVHRPGSVVAGTKHRSMHADCRAADFRVIHPRNVKAVLAYLRAHRIGGLGIYSGGYRHFHIDDGRVRDWFGSTRKRRARR